MARRRQFVSTGLHNISKHIAESTTAMGKGELDDEQVAVEQPVVVAAPAAEEPVVVEEYVEQDFVGDDLDDGEEYEELEDADVEITEIESEVESTIEQPQQSLMAHKRGDDLAERRAKEKQKALKRRAKEFVNARRDMMTRVSQSLAVIPDDIEECEMRIKLLRQHKERFEDLMLTLEPLDENAWPDDTYSSELGRAMKVIENSRIEFMSASARLEKMLKGEDTVVGTQNSFLAEIMSLSFAQLFRMGLIMSLPLVVGLVLAALIISVFMLISMS